MYYQPFCQQECKQKRPHIGEAAIDAMVEKMLGTIQLTDEEVAELEAARPTLVTGEALEREKALHLLDNRRVRAQRELKYLRENKLTLLTQAVYTPTQYSEEVARLEQELVAIEQQSAPVPMAERLAAVLTFSELVGLAQQSYKSLTPDRKRQMLLWVVSELTIDQGEISKISAKNAFRGRVDPLSVQLGRPCGMRLEHFWLILNKS